MIDYDLAKEIVDALTERKQTVATAESCTGGMVSMTITAVSGSSSVFNYGVTTYANEVKTQELSVPKEILDTKGAVSFETAKAMAEGVMKKANADYGTATTGIAGPTGGTKEKPVGTVYIAVASKTKTEVKLLELGEKCGDSRALIREETVNEVLKLLYSSIK